MFKIIHLNDRIFYASGFHVQRISLQTYNPDDPLTLKKVGVMWRVVASQGRELITIAEHAQEKDAQKVLNDIYNCRRKHLTIKEDNVLLWKPVQRVEAK